jgi:hypothetical protein
VAQATRPEREMHYWIAGREVSPEQFWLAVKDLGGRAVVETVEGPQEPTWRPTAKAKALEPEDFFREDGPFATEAALRAAKARDREAGR